MNNSIWKELIGRLYTGFHNETEVMAVIGYVETTAPSGNVVDVIEYIEYYTSHDESEVLGNFRAIVKGMAKYSVLRKDKAKFLVVHNHPAGTPDPSTSDVKMMERFQVVCRMLGAKMVGSYIFIDNDNIILVGSAEDELKGMQIRMSNQYPSGGNISMGRLASDSTFRSAVESIDNKTVQGVRLNEAVLNTEFDSRGFEPFGLVELDGNNTIKGIYELNKLLPNVEGRDELDPEYHYGLSLLFRRDNPRFVVYDKRNDVDRDELGLADDAKAFIQSMGIAGYPITFYIN